MCPPLIPLWHHLLRSTALGRRREWRVGSENRRLEDISGCMLSHYYWHWWHFKDRLTNDQVTCVLWWSGRWWAGVPVWTNLFVHRQSLVAESQVVELSRWGEARLGWELTAGFNLHQAHMTPEHLGTWQPGTRAPLHQSTWHQNLANTRTPQYAPDIAGCPGVRPNTSWWDRCNNNAMLG